MSTVEYVYAPPPPSPPPREALISADLARASTPHRRRRASASPRQCRCSDALKNTAQLIRADVGTEVVAVDYGSWDMHTDVGSVDGGSMKSMLSGFAKALAAFLDHLDDLRNRVTVVTISEFGRRVDENSASGLDHGWGNVMRSRA
jgi:uncharacterized protein (DUF1501 family)